MNAASEAKLHWATYLKLESGGVHAEYARTRLK